MSKISALAVVAGALASVLAVTPAPLPAAWAAEHLVVPDGPKKLDRWDPSLTPYIVEPLNLSSTEAPENEVIVRKSAQTGFTLMLLAATAHTIACDRADMMIVQPTDGALSDFNSKKLQPCIDETAPTAAVVARQASRSGAGSTTYEKRFGRYTLTLGLASSAADLRSKSVQKIFCDEVDEYPDDLDGQGSPLGMIEARLESFLKSGQWKWFRISTPTIVGASNIDADWQRSDKRYWHVACPDCGHEFYFEFGPHFRFQREWPYKAHYVCPGGCGGFFEEVDRIAMVRAGRWIATDPAAGRIRGYHFDTFSSPFVPWSKVAERIVNAGDDPNKLKTLYNLTFGLPFELKGDAPDHVRLMERREDLIRGHVPSRGLILTAAADVQMRGIWLEILATAPNRETWTVDALYLDGDTSSPDAPVFEQLRRETLERTFPDAWGRPRSLDALAVDSGYRSHVVYAWVRRNQRPHPDTGRDMVLAVKGLDGWGRPVIGQPTLVDIDLRGTKVKKGAKVWGVGTWSIKGAVYADLRKEGMRAGLEADPEGYCHFGLWLDEVYFRQMTAEYLADEKYRGRNRKVWKMRGGEKDNHFLDCRVYNVALAEYLGLSSMTPEDWATLAQRRGLPADESTLMLFAPRRTAAPSPAQPEAHAAPAHAPVAAPLTPARAARANDDWLGGRSDNWGDR